MKTVSKIAVVWVLCAFFNWGSTLGYFDNKFPQFDNVGIAGMMAIAGPLGLPGCLLHNSRPFHWRFTPPSEEERFAAFRARYGAEYATRERFDREFN